VRREVLFNHVLHQPHERAYETQALAEEVEHLVVFPNTPAHSGHYACAHHFVVATFRIFFARRIY
jgi:hypothetical protein